MKTVCAVTWLPRQPNSCNSIRWHHWSSGLNHNESGYMGPKTAEKWDCLVSSSVHNTDSMQDNISGYLLDTWEVKYPRNKQGFSQFCKVNIIRFGWRSVDVNGRFATYSSRAFF